MFDSLFLKTQNTISMFSFSKFSVFFLCFNTIFFFLETKHVLPIFLVLLAFKNRKQTYPELSFLQTVPCNGGRNLDTKVIKIA